VKNILFFLLIASVFFIGNIRAQNNYDFNQFADETADIVKHPLKWNPNDFLRLGLISGITIGLMQFDKTIKDFSQQDTSLVRGIPLEIGRYWGEPIPTLTIGLGFLLHGIIYENNVNKKVGFEVTQSFVYSTAITGSLKFIIGRARPYTTNNPFSFNPCRYFSDDYWSLPSGHTTIAFSLSTVLSENINSDILKILVYLPAFVTAYSRISYNNHWLSDVFLGGIIGFTMGKYITKVHNKNEWNISPTEQISIFHFSYSF